MFSHSKMFSRILGIGRRSIIFASSVPAGCNRSYQCRDGKKNDCISFGVRNRMPHSLQTLRGKMEQTTGSMHAVLVITDLVHAKC